MMGDYSIETCNEMSEILDHIPRELFDKLPKEIVNYFYQNASNDNGFKYNVALPILEQGVSDDTRNIIVFLSRVFWKEELHK